jgi:hypothetical protein
MMPAKLLALPVAAPPRHRSPSRDPEGANEAHKDGRGGARTPRARGTASPGAPRPVAEA